MGLLSKLLFIIEVGIFLKIFLQSSLLTLTFLVIRIIGRFYIKAATIRLVYQKESSVISQCLCVNVNIFGSTF